MTVGVILLLLIALLLWAMFADRLHSAPITGPLAVTTVGLLLAYWRPIEAESARLLTHALAELTLVVVLFTDAAKINVRSLLMNQCIPRKMLLIGLPGSIALGTLCGLWLFPKLGIWGAALLAAILAPTDAALGDAVVSNESVPLRIRQSLSVESGLNDGMVVPVVLLFACFTGFVHDIGSSTEWLVFGFQQIVFGSLAGLSVGYIGAHLLQWSINKQLLADRWQGIAALALAGIAWSGAELVHGNGFISAFVAGLLFGDQLRSPAHALFEFTESEGQILVLGTFALFGVALLPTALQNASPTVLVYALLSLTIVRMLPVLLSLIRVKLLLSSRFFLAWFGPRGLASLLFVLLIGEQSGLPQIELITTIVFCTVALSVVLHGITAGPIAKHYGNAVHQIENHPTDSVLSSTLRPREETP